MNVQKNPLRILITGVSGQVGFECFQLLQKQDYKLYPCSNEIVPEIPDAISLDLTDFKSIQRIFQEVKPHIVINPAAYTAVDLAETNQELCQAVNAHAPEYMALEAKKLGAFLIHFSTDYVFKGEGSKPYHEDDVKGPLNFYGKSKLLGEELIAKSYPLHIILRTSWVYGYRGKNFLNTMLRLGKERELLSVVNDQIGSPTSAYQLASITKSILHMVINHGIDILEHKTGIYHAVAKGYCSWFDFAEEIFKVARDKGGYDLKVKEVKPIPSEAFTTPAQRPKNSRLNTDKIKILLGNQDISTWQDALKFEFSRQQ